MIVKKITTGFVVQEFDTDKGEFVSQEFIAGDQCDYETEAGESVDPNEVLPTPEPYLQYNMVQPLGRLLGDGYDKRQETIS